MQAIVQLHGQTYVCEPETVNGLVHFLANAIPVEQDYVSGQGYQYSVDREPLKVTIEICAVNWKPEAEVEPITGGETPPMPPLPDDEF